MGCGSSQGVPPGAASAVPVRSCGWLGCWRCQLRGWACRCMSGSQMVCFVGEVSPSGVGSERRTRSDSTLCARAEIVPDGGCCDVVCGYCCGEYRRFALAGRRRHYLRLRFGSDGGLRLPVSIAPRAQRAGSIPRPLCDGTGRRFPTFHCHGSEVPLQSAQLWRNSVRTLKKPHGFLGLGTRL